ncbi:hypothetical protein B4135_0812 [Caldibacillus debilis]|uniref:Uncharacterized protein n=1 Tax=Caldibacillus debilis TaxID=301148 RepID=A0A150M5V4_9BACI|nr:hypothetical protein B4135_0812 [Caldibacillus debilis]
MKKKPPNLALANSMEGTAGIVIVPCSGMPDVSQYRRRKGRCRKIGKETALG